MKNRKVSMFIVSLLILLSIPFSFKWYTYVHSPLYTVKTFSKAMMDGDVKTIDHLNYTDMHEQTIKKAWIDKLKGYNFEDLEFKLSDKNDGFYILTAKGNYLDLIIEVEKMNNCYYVTNIRI